jgi:hypothetical protein
MRRCLTKPVSRYERVLQIVERPRLEVGRPPSRGGVFYGRVVPDRLRSGCRASARSDRNGNCPAVALAGAFFVPRFAAVDAFQRIRQKQAHLVRWPNGASL